MIYLFIALFFLLSIFLFERKKERRSIEFFYWLECLILIFLAGFRYKVGGDTLGYMAMWDELPTISDLKSFDFMGAKYQPLWYIINAIAKSIYNDFTTFQFMHATFVNISIFVVIKRYSDYRFSAILAYYLISFLYFNCEILRESIAICIFLFAVPSLVEKKWIRYYLLVTIAIFIHLSSFCLYFLPLLSFSFTKKTSLKTIFYILIAISFVLNSYIQDILMQNLFPFLERHYNRYSLLRFNTIGYVTTSIKCLALYILIYIRQRYNLYNKMADVGLKFYFFLSVITIFLPIIGDRFMNYFQIFFIIAFIDVFLKLRNKNLVMKSSIIAYFFLSTIYYYSKDITSWTGIEGTRFGERFYPYYSIFEDIPKDVLYKRNTIYYQKIEE
jgi:hypothetical protein